MSKDGDVILLSSFLKQWLLVGLVSSLKSPGLYATLSGASCKSAEHTSTQLCQAKFIGKQRKPSAYAQLVSNVSMSIIWTTGFLYRLDEFLNSRFMTADKQLD